MVFGRDLGADEAIKTPCLNWLVMRIVQIHFTISVWVALKHAGPVVAIGI
jgi:hypothetical protein